MLKKIMNFVGVNPLSKIEQVEVVAEHATPSNASFMCYCNSIFVGAKASIKECWKTC